MKAVAKLAAVVGVIAVAVVTILLIHANQETTPLPDGTVADSVIVFKSQRVMRLMAADSTLREYRIALGGNPVGHKQREGDRRTPEGLYVLDYRNPQSSFHLSYHVSYPNAADSAMATSGGLDPGGMIMVHGIRNGLGWIGKLHTHLDWTNGCIAITNSEMDEFWRVVPVGTPINIKP